MWHPQGKENLAKSKQTDEQTELSGITRSLQINHLKAETMYTFEVQARTKIGYGPPQSESFKTKHCKWKYITQFFICTSRHNLYLGAILVDTSTKFIFRY